MSMITQDPDRQKGANDDGWTQLHEHLLNDVLEAEVTEHTGTVRYEHREKRRA